MKNIVHRDIKLENILIDQHFNIKIIDFGFAIQILPNKTVTIFCGTPCYMAPEIVKKLKYTPAPTDIWAFGVLVYILMTGTFPFKGNMYVLVFITVYRKK